MGTKRYTITVDLPEELVEKAVRLCREYWASQGEDANISSVERYLEVEARVLLRAHLQVQIEKYPHLMEQ